MLLVLLGPWVLVWRISSRRKRERDEDNERWQELSSRTYALEQTVRALQAQRPEADVVALARAHVDRFLEADILLAAEQVERTERRGRIRPVQYEGDSHPP